MEEIYRMVIQDKKHNFYLVRAMREDALTIDVAANKILFNKQIYELDQKMAGFCMIETKDNESVEMLYEVAPEFRGTGLGSSLVDFSKDFAKMKGYKYALLNKIERIVPHPIAKNFKVDGNLQLYLNHNFKLSDHIDGKGLKFNMYCDLEEEEKMSAEQYMLSILDNKFEASKLREV